MISGPFRQFRDCCYGGEGWGPREMNPDSRV